MLKKVISSVLSIIMIISIVPLAVFAESEYDYPNKYLWYEYAKGMTWNDFDTIAEHHQAWAIPEYDINTLINSKQGEEMITGLKNFILYEDEMDPDVVEYWRNKGLKKELHDADDPDKKWSSFTPLSAYEEENKDKKYPVIFTFHGNENTIFVAETFGYTDVAAKYECIEVIPWAANNANYETEFFRILEELKENYPIDENRIYVVGFSQGGMVAQRLAQKHGEMLAGIGAGGCSFLTLTDEQYAIVKESNVPVVTYSGFADYNCPMLLYRNGKSGSTTGLDASAYKCEALTSWADALGVELELTSEQANYIHENSENAVNAKFGIEFEETNIVEHNETEYYIGSFYNSDGVQKLTYLGVENCPHWSAGYTAEIVWDMLKQYSRDTETGELIVNPDINANVDSEVKANELFSINVKSSSDIIGYFLQNESGKNITINSVEKNINDDGTIDWIITTKVGTSGERTINLIPVSSTYGVKRALEIPVTVNDADDAYEVKSMSFSTKAVLVNQEFNATIVTGGRTSAIAIRNEKGANMGKTLVSKTRNADGTITWVYSVKIGTEGINRTLSAYCKNAEGEYVSNKSASIAVVK